MLSSDFEVMSVITPPWLVFVMMKLEKGMRGHRERFDTLVAPIPTPFATLSPVHCLFALCKPTGHSHA